MCHPRESLMSASQRSLRPLTASTSASDFVSDVMAGSEYNRVGTR